MTRNPFQINIALADDHEIFRDGFRFMTNQIPYLKLIAEASSSKQLLAMAPYLKPDVILVNIDMPGEDSVVMMKTIIKKFASVRVIALTTCEEENMIAKILETGAKGYLQKNSGKQEIITAVKTVYQNQNYHCKITSSKLAKMINNGQVLPGRKKSQLNFTKNEITVIRMICDEFLNKEIADKLGLSTRTVEGYREKILAKTKAKNTAGIVIYAIRHNIYEMNIAG